jgi:hypothetical protein
MNHMPTKTTLAAGGIATALLLSSPAAADPLYSNGSENPAEPGIATGPLTGSGIAAPAGAFWSEVPRYSAVEANAIAGFACNNAGGVAGMVEPFRFADDFVLSGGGRWRISGISVFAYQPGAGAASPFDSVVLRIWNGPPDEPASSVIAGELTTNRLTAAVPLDVYRIFNSVVGPMPVSPTTDRRVWRLDLSVPQPLLLSSGTYWLEWQVRGSDPQAEVFCPPIVTPGSRGRAGANAMQLRAGVLGGQWVPLIDLGKPSAVVDVAQELPFMITGGIGCTADIGGGGSNADQPDGTIDGTDFILFINSFSIGDATVDPMADVAGGGPNADQPDGTIDGTDFIEFINAFAAGC